MQSLPSQKTSSHHNEASALEGRTINEASTLEGRTITITSAESLLPDTVQSLPSERITTSHHHAAFSNVPGTHEIMITFFYMKLSVHKICPAAVI